VDEKLYQDVEAKLLEARSHWERRLDAIRSDRRRERAPLDPDFAEQAVERENDATLDALDARGRQELDAIRSALERIAAKTLESCVRCGEPIAPSRLRAQPTAFDCLRCALNGRVT
jgi:RNA polymerase-binding transcription factor